MGRKAIPSRWLNYQALGTCISGTRIVAFKVPLKMNICRPNLPEHKWFTPAMLLEQLPHLKTVIDLTNTNRYYNSQEEFGTKGIDHVKILVEGQGKIPPDRQIWRFFDAMDTHMEKYADITDAIIGVHCTHGLNRTGYFICRWMVERLNMNPDEAIERFNQARGHDIERKPLLEHIRKTYFRSLPSMQAPPQSRIDRYYSPLDDAGYDEISNQSRYSHHGNRREYIPNKHKIDNRADRRRRGRNVGSGSDANTNWRLRGNDQTQEGSSILENRRQDRRNVGNRYNPDTNWRLRDNDQTQEG